MKNILITLILIVVSTLGYGQGMLYVFELFATEQYTNTDTTMVFVDNENICVFNNDFAWCDNILEYKKRNFTSGKNDNPEIEVEMDILYVTTDAVPYTLMFEDKSMYSVTLEDHKGNPIYLMNQIAEKQVPWTPKMTRSGWSIAMK